MIDIEGILSHEVDNYMISKEELAYLFTKFLLANRAYMEFVEEFISYHKVICSENLVNENPKDIIFSSIDNLKSSGRSIDEMITAYCSAFNWSRTRRGRGYWARLSDKWYDVTKSRFLGDFYLK